MRTIKSKWEILEETVAYYTTEGNKRAIDINDQCHYLDWLGNMCAVGRCMTKPTKEMIGSVTTLKNAHTVLSLESLLKPEYQGHAINFWSQLQRLHDEPIHWAGKQLTTRGKEFVLNIKNGDYL